MAALSFVKGAKSMSGKLFLIRISVAHLPNLKRDVLPSGGSYPP